MTSRKDKGDAAEKARQRYWEVRGAVVFPVSPSYPGVDLIVFLQDGVIVLSEVKGQKAKLYGKTLADALVKVKAARDRLRALPCATMPCRLLVDAELVHVHFDADGKVLSQEVLG
jgi:hypothetical protein